MNVLIIEDEKNLANQLKKILKSIDPEINVIGISGSVKSSIDLISKTDNIDLMLVDIYLSDGLSFEIFNEVKCNAPVIFCTAYDQYALKAFELDSVDYLLKPIKKKDLEQAVKKYKRLFAEKDTNDEIPGLASKIESLYKKISEVKDKDYQTSFLFTQNDRLIPVGTSDISYFQTSYGMIRCVTKEGQSFSLDQSLDSLIQSLNPNHFYRANRQFIISRGSVIDAEFYFNGRLYVNISPKPNDSVIISKAKATEFKEWLSEG